MFAIDHKIIKGFNCIVITDIENKTRASVVPDCGAILHSFQVIKDNEYVEVIDSYQSRNDFQQSAEKLGFKGCKLSPFVCRLKNGKYHFAENEYKIEKFYLGKHAIHGLLYNRAFVIKKEIIEKNYGLISLACYYRGEDKGYPFNYDCIINFKLEKNNRLTISTELINRDKGLIPVQDGWHPYFKLDETVNNLQLEFQAKQIISFNEQLIPDGKTERYQLFSSLTLIGDTKFDNCFRLNFAECQPMCVLRNAQKKLQVEIQPDISYPYLQIYIPDDRKSIALENLSGPPDAFNSGNDLKILSPGETSIYKTTYTVNLLI